MTIWILAIIVLLAFGAIGFWRGAIRVMVSWAGLILGLLFADSLAVQIRPLLTKLGLTHPLWNGIVALPVAFIIILLLWKIVVFLVHRQIYTSLQYRADDVQLIRWDRFNRQLGACLALLTGSVYLCLIGIVLYVGGHLTAQLNATTAPSYVRLVSQGRADLKSSGLEKLVVHFDPMPAKYYQACDALALIYHNPQVHARLAAYPRFLTFRFNETFQNLANSRELMDLLKTGGSPIEILAQPEVVAILENQELMSSLKSVDYKDLQTYLKTGSSPKYKELPILGIWKFNAIASAYRLQDIFRTTPDLPQFDKGDFHRARRYLTAKFHGMTLTVTTESEAFFEFEPTDELKRFASLLAKMEPDFNSPNLEPFTKEGTWTENSGKYELQVEGVTTEVSIEANDNRLILTSGPLVRPKWPFLPKWPFVFFRVW